MVPPKIARFRWAQPWLAAGAQPEEAQFAELEELGVAFIVNLRQRDESIAVRRSTRRAEPVQIPVRDNHAPTMQQALRWLDLVAAHAPQDKLYVHCHEGHGRTSTFCALVRLAQGADVERAIDEERAFGFEPGEKHKEQAAFLRAFADALDAGRIDAPKIPKD